MGEEERSAGGEAPAVTRSMPTLFRDDFAYLEAAIRHLRQSQPLQAEFLADRRRVDLTPPEDLKQRFRFLPREIRPEDGVFILSSDPATIQDETKRSRKDENAWPNIHFLRPLNPVLEWVNDKVVAAFGRHEAPVMVLQRALAPGEVVFILAGLIPNRKSHPLVHRWIGISFRNRQFHVIEDFQALLERTIVYEAPFDRCNREKDYETAWVEFERRLHREGEGADLLMDNV